MPNPKPGPIRVIVIGNVNPQCTDPRVVIEKRK